MAKFTSDFWRDLGKLGIYSTEAGDDTPTLADQMDAGVPGGANASDTAQDAPADDGTGGADIDMGGDMGDMGGDMSGGSGDASGGDMGGGDATGGGDLGGGNSTPVNPNENPFKSQNGKALLDNKLAELQAAISDTLERVYANSGVDQVVVSELENLQDSVRNIRETVFLVPVDATLYKYQLSTISYKNLSEQIVTSLRDK